MQGIERPVISTPSFLLLTGRQDWELVQGFSIPFMGQSSDEQRNCVLLVALLFLLTWGSSLDVRHAITIRSQTLGSMPPLVSDHWFYSEIHDYVALHSLNMEWWVSSQLLANFWIWLIHTFPWRKGLGDVLKLKPSGSHFSCPFYHSFSSHRKVFLFIQNLALPPFSEVDGARSEVLSLNGPAIHREEVRHPSPLYLK